MIAHAYLLAAAVCTLQQHMHRDLYHEFFIICTTTIELLCGYLPGCLDAAMRYARPREEPEGRACMERAEYELCALNYIVRGIQKPSI